MFGTSGSWVVDQRGRITWQRCRMGRQKLRGLGDPKVELAAFCSTSMRPFTASLSLVLRETMVNGPTELSTEVQRLC